MRLKVSIWRYAMAVFAFLLPTAVLAAILPFLVNTQPVRTKLLREIGSWTGAEVKVAGAISVKDLFSLSVEAQNVEIGQFKSIAPVEGMKADSIVARIAWTDLLLGNLQFDKIKIVGAVFKVRTGRAQDIPGLYADLISGEDGRPFAALQLVDCVIALRPERGMAYRRVRVQNATARSVASGRELSSSAQFLWKGSPVTLGVRSGFHVNREAPIPLRLRLASAPVSGRFDGSVQLGAALGATGELALEGPDLAGAARWLGIGARPAVLATAAFAMSGPIVVSRDSAALSSGAISLAGQTAQAGLTLNLAKAVPHLEGALAFNRLDLKPLFSGMGIERLTGEAPSGPLIETDLRLSARFIAWDDVAAGSAALTLTSRGRRLTAEIAELDVLGGEARGQIALEMAGAATRASARLSVESIDAAGLLSLMGQRDWLTGAADVNVEVESVWTDPAEIRDRMVAKARVNFPEGGQMRLDIPRLAAASPSQTDGWGAVDFTNATFDRLRFEMTLQGGQLRFVDVLLASAGGQVNGSGEIDLASRWLDWRFTLPSTGAPQSGAPAGGGVAGAMVSRLSIKGPWTRPVIRSGEGPDSSMLARPRYAAAALELSSAGR